MFLAAMAAGCVCVAVWLYLLTGRGGFWMVRAHSAVGRFARVEDEKVIAAVVPARNEADVIGRAVASLLKQANELGASPLSPAAGGAMGLPDLHVFVVDDNSTDRTAEAALQAAWSNPGRVTMINGAPLPSGWSGKVWAMQQGIEHALALNPDFLLFTDADIEHAPGNLATLVDRAESGSYDLVSCMVKLHCRTLAERFLIPAFVFFFFLLYPPRWIRDPRRSTAGAAGGCILIRPSALERIGGLAAIRGEIIDDCALARAVKRRGGKVWLGVTADTQSLRPYRSFAEVGRMIARTAFNQLRHSVWLLLGCVLGMLLIFVLPLVLLASGSLTLTLLGGLACVLMIAAYLPMVRFYDVNLAWSLTLPFSAMFYTFATIHSAMKYWSGRGGEWKGRAQDAG